MRLGTVYFRGMDNFLTYTEWKARRNGRKRAKPFNIRKAVESTLRRGRRIIEKHFEGS